MWPSPWLQADELSFKRSADPRKASGGSGAVLRPFNNSEDYSSSLRKVLSSRGLTHAVVLLTLLPFQILGIGAEEHRRSIIDERVLS